MQETNYYLREEVYFEPLLHKWYMWPYLIPPVSAAMNITGRNLRLMKSFVKNHRLHISASQDPKLAGGDFVNCREDQLGDIQALIEDIEINAQYAEIRAAVTELDRLLERQEGSSLEQLYDQVPAILRGYVELVYDMNHHASYRLLESLIYRGGLYRAAAQSVSLGLLSQGAERPFVLSSPRLPDGRHLHVQVPLADDFLDALFRLRERPAQWNDIAALFAQQQLSGGLELKQLFTDQAPKRGWTPVESGLRICYLGHAGLLIESRDASVLVDPVIACATEEERDGIYSFSELPPVIDYICVTHTHMDHVCIETLLQLRHKTRKVLVPKNNGGGIADPSICLMLRRLGFDAVECEDLDEAVAGEIKLTALPFLGEHADLNIRSKCAWLFEHAGRKVFVGADSSSIDEVMYARLHGIIGDVDMLFIGMECVGAPLSWLYGSLFTKPIPRAVNESRRFNGSDFQSARKMIDIFQPQNVCVYAMGAEPWFRYFMGMEYAENARQVTESNLLLEYCVQQDIVAERLLAKRTWVLPDPSSL
ncbi:MBL fold metallo-hydrolase [Massilia sp. BJB1822]|uniref:MBL fold metallo-hydrolase n=1 Tax=Massilia sp. BJB1822 TaxID=2744470 RepID=UPI0015931E59|nr:MBL fold metallo-hydrolase [Massilia sp. BJB1822]NVE00637.1 MBL fold metallo-hydrolase [Massilia sp. BJB1822]